jgi:UDP-GlcNAc:undecaprenyl-phosphate GlcNAc-1-phosphate transferase
MPSVLGVLALIVVTVVLVNGVNMVDGLDALAGGVALMSALGFAVLLDGDARTIALALAGGLGGFLVFNRPPARIYLGDGGSYLVGTTLAVLLCLAWRSESAPAVSAGSLFLVACPVADLACAVLRRLRDRRPLFMGDRSHPYDRLVDAGWSKPRAAGTYIAVQAVLSAVGAGVGRLGTAAATAVTVATIVGLLAVVARVSLQGSGDSKAAA